MSTDAALDAGNSQGAAPSGASVRLLPFGFAEKTNFDARQELQNSRSRHFRVPRRPEEPDIWKRPPPDFRPQAWAPRPPKRNSRDAVQPWRYAADSDAAYADGRRQQEAAGLPLIARPKRPEQRRMQTVFRTLRPDTARRRFVRDGACHPGPYDMPAVHDYRQYPPLKSLGLPEFTTAIEKDPYNIQFLTRSKDTIVGPLHEIKNLRDASGTLWSAVHQPPKWDPKLHLPQNKFPNRLCEYSRYRPRNRDPFVAFMDSVESTLEQRWREEKLSKSAAAPLSG